MTVLFTAKSVELKDQRSRALLTAIQTDISDTLSAVAVSETGDWTLSLSRTREKLIKTGVVIESTSSKVLTVSADGLGSKLGLMPGDVIEQVVVNSKLYSNNFSVLELTHGDHLKVEVSRGEDTVILKQTVSSSFVPKWELYSNSSALISNDKVINSAETTLQSKIGLALLKKLQERINHRLSEIYRLESKINESELKFDIQQQRLMDTRLGMLMDKKSKRVIRVEQGGNAYKGGLEVDDILTDIRVNDQSIDNISDLQLKNGDEFQVRVKRDDEVKNISFTIASFEVPAWTLSVDSEVNFAEGNCGIITVFFDPPFTKDIYKAFLTEVNGDLLPKGKREDSITLAAGKHRILIHDQVPSRLKRRNPRGKGKLIEFMVQPNKRYFLGVKYNREERFSNQGKYWQPYVWKVEDYECSL